MLQLFKKKKKEKLPARIRGNSCLNCGIALEGEENFCPNCGQRNNINQLSFKLFVEEFFGDVFSYDSRLWGTVFPLILKPGKVAFDFVSGKRKKLVNPFRTYLTVSLVFFLVLGLIKTIEQYNGDGTKTNGKISFLNFNDGNDDDLTGAQKDSIVKAALLNVKNNAEVDIDSALAANNINLDSIDVDKFSKDSLKEKLADSNSFVKKVKSFYDYYELHQDHAPSQAFDSLGYKNTFWNRFYYDKSANVYKMQQDEDSFVDKFLSGISIAVFLFLPIFALFFKLIYVRRKYTYMEHMVFVFYTQSVFFLLMLLFLIINSFSNNEDTLIPIFMLLFSVYIYLAMRRFYQQGWFKTFVKFTLVNFSFMIMSSIGIVILGLISFIFY